MEKLTDKQEQFCRQYLIDFNGTQAAIRAGFSEKTANEQASRMLANVNIQNFIKSLQKDLQKRTGITAERVIAEFAKIGFSNIQDYLNEDNSIKDLTTISRKKASPVASIKVTQEQYQDGDLHVTKTEFKLYDKVKALENLGKHLGIYEADNEQVKQMIAPTINILPKTE